MDAWWTSKNRRPSAKKRQWLRGHLRAGSESSPVRRLTNGVAVITPPKCNQLFDVPESRSNKDGIASSATAEKLIHRLQAFLARGASATTMPFRLARSPVDRLHAFRSHGE